MNTTKPNPDIKRMQKEHHNLKRRMLVIDASPDVPEQYLPVMNCIFSAQKLVNS